MRFRLPPLSTRVTAAGLAATALSVILVAGSPITGGAVGPTLPPKSGGTPTTKKASTGPTTPKAAPKKSSSKSTSKSTAKAATKKPAVKKPTTRGSFTMAANPSRRTVAAGETTTTEVGLKKSGGFSSIVNITASGVPDGVKLSFPPRIQNFAPVTAKISTSVDDGTYRITFRGTSGGISRTAVFTLVVDGILEGAVDDPEDTLPVPGPDGSTTTTIAGAPPASGASTTTTASSTSTTTTTPGIVRSLSSTTIPVGGTTPVGSTVAGTTIAPGDFTLTAAPFRIIVPVGGTANLPVTASAAGAPVTNVAYVLTNVPNGVTATVGAANAQGVSTVAIAAGANAPAVTAVVTVSGTANGRVKTTTFELVVITDMAVAVNPPSFTAAPGGAASGAVSVVGVPGFATQANLTITGLPSGVTPAFAVPTLLNATTTLTLTVAANVPAGTYPFTVTATAGNIVRNSLATLVVGTAPASASVTPTATGTTVALSNTGTAAELSLTLNPITLSAPVGGAARITATVSGTAVGTAGAIISVGGLPQNASVSVVANPTTSTSTITIIIGSPVVIGTYPITVTATAGTLFRTATTQLTVTA